MHNCRQHSNTLLIWKAASRLPCPNISTLRKLMLGKLHASQVVLGFDNTDIGAPTQNSSSTVMQHAQPITLSQQCFFCALIVNFLHYLTKWTFACCFLPQHYPHSKADVHLNWQFVSYASHTKMLPSKLSQSVLHNR